MSRLRIYLSPRLLVRPSRSLPPLEFCRGVIPSQAANSRPERNSEGSATVAAIARTHDADTRHRCNGLADLALPMPLGQTRLDLSHSGHRIMQLMHDQLQDLSREFRKSLLFMSN